MTTETILTPEQVHELCWITDSAEELARRVEHAVLQSPEIQALRRDSELLSAIEAQCWDVRFGSSPNGDAGDSSITIEIVGHFMEKPKERVIGENHNERLRPALEQAMTADAYPPARPEYEDDGGNKSGGSRVLGRCT